MTRQQLRIACQQAAKQRAVMNVAREAGVTPNSIYALIARGNFATKNESALQDALVRLGYLKGEVLHHKVPRPNTVIAMVASELEVLAAMLCDKRLPLGIRLGKFETTIVQYHANLSSFLEAMTASEMPEEE